MSEININELLSPSSIEYGSELNFVTEINSGMNSKQCKN